MNRLISSSLEYINVFYKTFIMTRGVFSRLVFAIRLLLSLCKRVPSRVQVLGGYEVRHRGDRSNTYPTLALSTLRCFGQYTLRSTTFQPLVGLIPVDLLLTRGFTVTSVLSLQSRVLSVLGSCLCHSFSLCGEMFGPGTSLPSREWTKNRKRWIYKN